MPQPQQNINIAAPGFAGLNTQDSPIGMDLSFAGIADNCIIDDKGRISSRGGFQAVTADPDTTGQIGDAVAETVYEYKDSNGTAHILFSGMLEGGSTEAMWSQSLAGTATRVTGITAVGNNWDYASLSDQCFIAQEGNDVQYTDDGLTFQAMTQQPQVVTQPNIITSGLGHLWVASSVSNKTVVEWSVITSNLGLGGAATPWTGSGSGSIDIEEYWPNGSDNITALAVHNNFLVIFGSQSILVYTIPSTGTNVGPEFMYLSDTIENIGCVARDSVTNIGTDLAFLDASGLRSLARTIQEKSMPIGDLSYNVRDDLVSDVTSTDGEVRCAYSQEEALFILIVPKNTGTVTYVFDTRRPLPNGQLRVTKWLGRDVTCAKRVSDGSFLIGRPGGLYKYTGGEDRSFLASEDSVTPVNFTYQTQPQDFDKPANTKMPKQVDLILLGASTYSLNVRWYFDFSREANTKVITSTGAGGAQWGVGQWGAGVYGSTTGDIRTSRVNMWGQGKNIVLEFTGSITEQPVSIQELNVQALFGRIQ